MGVENGPDGPLSVVALVDSNAEPEGIIGVRNGTGIELLSSSVAVVISADDSLDLSDNEGFLRGDVLLAPLPLVLRGGTGKEAGS